MSIVDRLAQYRIFACFLWLFCTNSFAAGWQEDISVNICQQWKQISALSQECELSFPGLSNRYQLPECQEEFQYQLLRTLTPGRNGIELSCQAPRWQQNFAVHLHAYMNVVVLAAPIGMGQPITHTDIALVRHDLSSLNAEFFTNQEQVVGQILQRNVRAGTVLTPSLLNAPQLIDRGDLVTIQVQRAGVAIEVQGTALERGKYGQLIRVRNNQSNNIIAARVLKSGLVKVE